MRVLLSVCCVLLLAVSASAATKKKGKGKRKGKKAAPISAPAETPPPPPAAAEPEPPNPPPPPPRAEAEVEEAAAEVNVPPPPPVAAEPAEPDPPPAPAVAMDPPPPDPQPEPAPPLPSLTDSRGLLRDGFFMQLNAGLGYYKSSTELLGTEATYSGTTIATSLLLGGALMDNLAIGGGIVLDRAGSPNQEVNGEKVESAVSFTQYVFALTGFVDYYLPMIEGLHVQALVGWGGLETAVEGNAGGSDPVGLLYGIGCGYEIGLSESWSVGVLARLAYGSFKMVNGPKFGTWAPALALSMTYF